MHFIGGVTLRMHHATYGGCHSEDAPCILCTVKNGVLRYTFAMVFWDTFIYVGVT